MVFHTASPVSVRAFSSAQQAQKKLFEPAIQGTVNVLSERGRRGGQRRAGRGTGRSSSSHTPTLLSPRLTAGTRSQAP